MDDMKGEILFKDGLKVHFKCYRGQRINTIKYLMKIMKKYHITKYGVDDMNTVN